MHLLIFLIVIGIMQKNISDTMTIRSINTKKLLGQQEILEHRQEKWSV